LGNTIYLSATEKEVEEKVMSMYTDPTRLKATDPGHVEGNPVFIYLDNFGTEADSMKISEYKHRYKNGQVGDVEVKQYLIQVINNFLEPIRKRREEYNNEERLLEIARKGTQRAREETIKTLGEVKRILGLVY
jgi:tryptophanyl-tRNA synthetase